MQIQVEGGIIRDMTPEEEAEFNRELARERQEESMYERLLALEECMRILLEVEDDTGEDDRSSEEEESTDGQGQ